MDDISTAAGVTLALEGCLQMIDAAISWLLAHPLEGVGGLAAFAVVVSLVLIPRIHEVTDHGHPRC